MEVPCKMLHHQENEADIDLEEAVGSYLNCLSTSCAAGSKLYTSVGKIIDEKFHEIFPDQELNNQLVKTCFQSLQVQNAFEGYQKALLECKGKLLEILIDNHTKKQQPSKDSKHKKETSPEEQYAAIAFIVAKELYCYHQTVAEVLKPLLFSDFQEDFENATLTSVDGKDNIVTAWLTVSEANKVLRQGYGLTNSEIGQILSWQHGADLSESCRKRLNQKITQLIQLYVDNFYSSAACEEIDIPLAFSRYPDDIQKLLQNCCSPSEAFAASAQGIPVVKEEIEVMLHRELPRISICLNGKYYDKASPGKAFENTTLKMRAIRDIISNVVQQKKIDASKEQIDLFCLRVLATSSITISHASSRTAVILAFGKCNLVQVKPFMNHEGEKVVYFYIHKDDIEIDIQSKWCITEDSTLFASLCRENTLRPIATVDVSYHVIINIEEYLVKRIEPTPIAHITQCVLRQSPSGQQKKEPGRERSKSIKIRLTKATTKLFHRKSVTKSEAEADIIANEYTSEGNAKSDVSEVIKDNCDPESEAHPIPPPRHKRKAKKSRKTKTCEFQLKEKEKERKEKEEKKEDLGWYSSSPKFGIPPVPTVPTVSGSKDFSPSVASFEELQGVIDFLSGSSSSSLAVNEKGEKIRPGFKAHKRNNSTTSLQSETKVNKVTPEGKLKLCHKKSASFSGKTIDMKTKEAKEESVENEAQVPNNNEKSSTENLDNLTDTGDCQNLDLSTESDASIIKTVDSSKPSVVNVERTPGDGMDHKIDGKQIFNSTINITTSLDADKNIVKAEKKDLLKSDNTVLDSAEVKNITSKTPEVVGTQSPISLSASMSEVSLGKCNEIDKNVKKAIVKKEDGLANKLEFDPVEKKTNNVDPPLKRNIFSPPQMSLIDISKDYSQTSLTKHVNNDIMKSEPNNLNSLTATDNSFYGTHSITPNAHSITPNAHSITPSIKNLNTTFESDPLSNVQTRIPTDLERNVSKIPAPVKEFDIQSEEHNQQILYEPFNSKWSVALGGKSATWSDATFNTECQLPKSEKPRMNTNKVNETEFTLDKQLDFNKLLEGSKFFAGQSSINENWKDRSYLPGAQNIFESQEVFPLQQQQLVPSDPWLSQLNNHPRNYSPFSSNPSYQSKRNIESLQLPPNPVGPYMRQNREQLLAKQQILEQYARHQKQMQIQQQQHQVPGINSKQILNNTMTPQPVSTMPSSNNNFRMPNLHSIVDHRSMSLPPGISMNDRLNNQRYDMLPERPIFRPSNLQRNGSGNQVLYNNQFSGMQSCSVNDIRVENPPMLNERVPFSQMSEQNIFLPEQYNPLPDAFPSRY